MLEALSRWNRWGSARLDPGQPRDAVADVLPFLDTKDVVTLVGPRRAGKSTIMLQLMDQLEARGVPPEAVLHVNLEEPALEPRLGMDLLEEVYRTYRAEVFPRGRAHVFLDEVQRVPEWERWVRARNETEDIKVFVTGSSSALLSRETGAVLTGRHVQFTIWPLSFREVLRFRGVEVPLQPERVAAPAPVQHALLAYLRWGGFPEVVLAKDEARKELLLRQYFDDVLFKDVALRHEVRDVPTLRALAVHLLTLTASLVSYQRLATTVGVSLDLVRSHCGFLEEAFLVQFAPFLSLKVAERRRNPQKVHAVDTGLRNAVCFSASEDRGRLAESAAFGALMRTSREGLHHWRGRGEVDLARRSGNRTDLLVQVALEADEDGLERETAALVDAGEKHPGARRILAVNRPLGRGSVVPEGIEVVPLWRFLLDPPTVRKQP